MASSNQYSWGLKFFLASLVLLFLFAITVESRAVSFTAPLLPEHTGKVDKNNKKYVGNAIGYVALRGRNAFGLYVFSVSNINPSSVTRVSLFPTSSKKTIIANLTYNTAGYYTVDQRIDYNTGADLHQQEYSIGYWIKKGKSETLAISGPLSSNRTTFISYLQSSEVLTTPSGTSKKQGFASIHLWTNDSVNYFVTGAVSHDLSSSVSQIYLNGPAPSGTENGAYSIALTKQNKAGRVFQQHVNSTVYYWLANHLTYISINSTKNPDGDLRGQVIPLTAPRARVPTFPNGYTQIFRGTELTFLPGGEQILGNLTHALLSGGARPTNKTVGQIDDRVAYFFANGTTFNYNFRFPLPVTLVNRFNTRGALVVVTTAAEVADNQKWTVGLYDLSSNAVVDQYQVLGQGNRTYTTVTADLAPNNFLTFLGPGGIFVNVAGSGVANPLYVDRFYTIYYVGSALSNSIVRRIFATNSPVQNANNRRR